LGKSRVNIPTKNSRQSHGTKSKDYDRLIYTKKGSNANNVLSIQNGKPKKSQCNAMKQTKGGEANEIAQDLVRINLTNEQLLSPAYCLNAKSKML
jgi:hypothetical protein